MGKIRSSGWLQPTKWFYQLPLWRRTILYPTCSCSGFWCLSSFSLPHASLLHEQLLRWPGSQSPPWPGAPCPAPSPQCITKARVLSSWLGFCTVRLSTCHSNPVALPRLHRLAPSGSKLEYGSPHWWGWGACRKKRSRSRGLSRLCQARAWQGHGHH